MTDLGNPHKAFRSVHIAGTKGKGSTATMLYHMLKSNKMTVGLYTSPHINDIRERIIVSDQMIPEAAMTKYIARISQVSQNYGAEKPTYFEILTAVAFLYFQDLKVDVAVVETGLGGRLDATNVLRPEVCGLTSISYDHMAQLGSSLEEIAEEKAGIFKEEIPVISAPQPKNVKMALRKVAEKSKTPLYFAGDDIEFSYRFESSRALGPQARICVTTATSHFDHLPVPLVGEHQAVNCGVAVGLLDALKNRGFALSDEASIAGLSKVSLEGRMEMLCNEPRVLADGAHNAASIDALMRAIGQNVASDSMVVIFGCCCDKDIPGMLKLIQHGADKVIFTRINSPRAAEPTDLAAQFTELSGKMAQISQTLPQALEIAEKAVTREDLICITGSFYLVAEAKRLFADHPHRVKTESLV
jgi:dihydrofolate synthase/folylpolyglutamate synthase